MSLLERIGVDRAGPTLMGKTLMVAGCPIDDPDPTLVLVAHPDEVDTLLLAVELLRQRDPSLDVEVHAHPAVPRGSVMLAAPPTDEGTSVAV